MTGRTRLVYTGSSLHSVALGITDFCGLITDSVPIPDSRMCSWLAGIRSTHDPTRTERDAVRHECRSVNRNCCLGIWNLYFVFQFPNCRARRVSWILHGDIWILKSVQVPKSAARRGDLDSGWPEPVFGNCSSTPKTLPPAFRHSVSGAPPVFLNRYRSFLVSWKLGILESGNCEHFTGTACMHVSRNAKSPCNVARPPAAWPERASLQRAPRAARHRVGARSHPRRTG